jgi:hypothetical protein
MAKTYTVGSMGARAPESIVMTPTMIDTTSVIVVS